jgi:hypothetical protein
MLVLNSRTRAALNPLLSLATVRYQTSNLAALISPNDTKQTVNLMDLQPFVSLL